MLGLVLDAAAGVPVPDLGVRPRLYTSTAFVMVLGALAALGVVLFVAQALTAPRRATAGGRLLLPFVVTTLMVVASLAVMYVVMETGRDAAFDRVFAYDDRADAERAAVLPLLEEHYGVQIADPWVVPVAGDLPGRTDVTLPGGETASCYIIASSTYEIRCGGVSPHASQPLPPVSGASD